MCAMRIVVDRRAKTVARVKFILGQVYDDGDNEDDLVEDDRQGDDCLTLECLLSSSPPTSYMESANLTLVQVL